MKKNYLIALIVLASMIVAGGIVFSAPAYANCGCCCGGGHDHETSHDSQMYDCGWCSSHSYHHCSMTNDSWELFFDKFDCPPYDDEHPDQVCTNRCMGEHLLDAFKTLPPDDDSHRMSKRDRMVNHLIDLEYISRDLTKMDDFAFCYDCMRHMAKTYADDEDSGTHRHKNHSRSHGCH